MSEENGDHLPSDNGGSLDREPNEEIDDLEPRSGVDEEGIDSP